MKRAGALAAGVAMLFMVGCASNEKRDETKAELEKARAAAIKVAQSLADHKKQAAEEAERLKQQASASAAELEAVRQEHARTAAELDAARTDAARLKQESVAEVRALQQERAQAAAELEAARQAGARAAAELEETRSKLAVLEQAPQPANVNVAMTLTAPPEMTEKLRRLEGEVEENVRERQRLEEKAARLEEQLLAKLRADSESPPKRQEEPVRITIVDRLLFESGEAELKPVGCKVLRQFAEKLKQASDKQIRVEGHTDNKLPKPKLRERYPSNWELSTARANNVVRCLIRSGGIPPEMLSAVGYADSRPVASNDSEEGRRKNRRVEIVLYPRTPTEETLQTNP